MKILLLEDDFVLNELISNYLSAYYNVDVAYTSKDALEKIYNNKYDMFIFDINLPDISGIDLLDDLRSNFDNTPTVFISAYHDIQTLKKAFQKGANDYLKKPFELEELKLRIQNISNEFTQTSLIEISSRITLNKSKQIICVDSIEYFITQKQCEVLLYLIKKRTQVVSFEELYMNVWGYDVPSSDTTLRTYIKNIRKIIGKDSIKTIYKQGYILE